MRQLIEGKLQEECEVRDVEVVLQEASFRKVELSLADEEGVFLEIDSNKPLEASVDSAELEQRLSETESQNTSLMIELMDELSERKEVARFHNELRYQVR